MAIALSALAALAVMIAGGSAAYALVARDRNATLPERAGFAILLGTLMTSLAMFIASLFFWRFGVILAVTLIDAVLLIAVALRRRKRQVAAVSTRPRRAAEIALIALMTIHVLAALWITHQRGIGWDGLFVWNIKARAFSVNQGRIPLYYFSDPTRRWSHQNYPLLLPLTETWVYLWIGSDHQSAGKYAPLIFYFAAIGLLYGAGVRMGRSRFHGLLTAALPLFIPFVIFGEGSATSGYADFPLAVFYFAALMSIIRGIDEENAGALALAGLMAAGLAWTKQEGLILWAVVSAICAVVVFLRTGLRRAKLLALAIAPGAVILVGWRIFLAAAHSLSGGAFVPMTLHTAISNIGRLRPIVYAMFLEFAAWSRWSILWPLFVIALIQLWRLQKRAYVLVLATAVVLPLSAYAFVYLFSAWNPFMNHVYSSLSRLILQLVLPVIAAIAAAAPRPSPGIVVNDR